MANPDGCFLLTEVDFYTILTRVLIYFSGRFANLNTLNTLKLCGNNITRPPKEALGSLQSLQNLYLNNNGLTTLKKNAFGNLPVVSTLELSGNKIFNVSYAAFEDLRQLTAIDLSSNNLSWVPPGAFLGKFYSQPKKACKISPFISYFTLYNKSQ